MKFAIQCVAAVLLAMATSPGSGRADDLKDCQARLEPAKAIAACTKIVDSKSAGRDELVSALIARAWAVYHDGNKNAAMADFDKAVETDASSVRALEERAMANSLRSLLEYRERAILDYAKALVLEPQRASVYAKRARIFSQLGKWEQAFADYDKAVQLDPKNADYFAQRASAHGLRSDWKQAVADYTAALTLDKAATDYLLHRGLANLRLGEKEKADADFEKAIESFSDRATGYQRRSSFLWGQDLARALSDINKAIELSPKRPDLYEDRGTLNEFFKNDLSAAIADYEKALNLVKSGPDRARIYSFKAGAYGTKGDLAAAIADFSKAIEIDKGAMHFYLQRAAMYARKNDYESAMSDYNTAIKLGPNFASNYISRGQLLLNNNFFDRASDDFDKALSLDDAATSVFTYRARIYQVKGKTAEAIDEYQKRILKSPSAVGFYDRGRAYSQMGEFGLALEDFNKAIEMSPKTAPYYVGRGEVLFEQRELDAAFADFTKALEFNSKLRTAFFGRGRVFHEKGLYDEAIKELDQALAVSKDYIPAHVLRGRALEEKGANEEAMEQYRKAIAIVPEATDEDGRTAKSDALKKFQALKATMARPIEKDAGVRVALLIANAKYNFQERLKNPYKDVGAFSEKLKTFGGFKSVTVREDLPLEAMKKALQDFGDEAEKADWALLFYSGHGIQIDKENYLIPVDAKIKRSDRVEDEAIALSWVLRKMRDARKLRIVILDACRENPFLPEMERKGSQTRAITRGLAALTAQSGELVALSAQPGDLADDGDGEHSPYAEALLKHIHRNVGIDRFFRMVREDVMLRTNKRQEPASYATGLSSDEYRFRVR